MNTLTVVFLCVQACLVQSVFSQCGGCGYSPVAGIAPALGCGGAALGYGGLAASSHHRRIGAYGSAAGVGYAASGASAYGGAGEGNVAVAGELPVAGNTAVIGQVPILGAVRFEGAVPACGAVSIAGQCACGCGY
ncbi:chorion class A protein Ld12-like [Anticarsia gemmatalis]|uniref:chorion class A protein Ld12-like n=1 Tax=Anticarsia gemmatalis TaxID=129554 RepID=UPI003F771B6F